MIDNNLAKHVSDLAERDQEVKELRQVNMLLTDQLDKQTKEVSELSKLKVTM